MTLEHEPTDEELLAIYSTAEGDSSYDGWRALWRAGAEWVSQRDPSPEEIEAVAHVLHEEFCMTRVYEGQGDDERVVGITPWDWLGDESRERYRTAARAALEAVEALEEVEWEYMCDREDFRRFTNDLEQAKRWRDRGYTIRRRTRAVPAGPWIALEGETP